MTYFDDTFSVIHLEEKVPIKGMRFFTIFDKHEEALESAIKHVIKLKNETHG